MLGVTCTSTAFGACLLEDGFIYHIVLLLLIPLQGLKDYFFGIGFGTPPVSSIQYPATTPHRSTASERQTCEVT